MLNQDAAPATTQNLRSEAVSLGNTGAAFRLLVRSSSGNSRECLAARSTGKPRQAADAANYQNQRNFERVAPSDARDTCAGVSSKATTTLLPSSLGVKS